MSDHYCICVRVEDAYTAATPTLRLREALARTLAGHDVPADSGVTLLVTCNEEVRRLNAQFRGVDAPTDVLSFPAGDPVPGAEDDHYLGDILIAHPYTAAQAAQAGHALDDELALLAVHGALHLLGYDHDTPETQAEMWAAQAAVLAALGISPAIVPAYAAEE